MRSLYLLRSMCTSREYVYYIGSLKSSIWNAGSQKCCNYLENTQLDGRNAANSVACKTEGLGHHLGTHTMGGGQRHGTRQHIFIYIYIYKWSRPAPGNPPPPPMLSPPHAPRATTPLGVASHLPPSGKISYAVLICWPRPHLCTT